MLIFNFYKRLILNLQDQELITCSQILHRTLTIHVFRQNSQL